MSVASPPMKEKQPRPRPQQSKSSLVTTPPKNLTLTQRNFVWLSLENHEKHWIVNEKNGQPLVASDHPVKALYTTVKKVLEINPQATIYYDVNCSQTIKYYEETLRKSKSESSRQESLFLKVMFLKDAPYRKQRQSKRIMGTAEFLQWCWEKKNPTQTLV